MAKLEERFLLPGGKPNHSELLREAFRRLGTEATASDAAAWIKKTYGVEVNPAKANVHRESVRKTLEAHLKRTQGKAATMQATLTVSNGHAEKAGPLANGDFVADVVRVLRATRDLIALAGGKDRLKELIDLL